MTLDQANIIFERACIEEERAKSPNAARFAVEVAEGAQRVIEALSLQTEASGDDLMLMVAAFDMGWAQTA